MNKLKITPFLLLLSLTTWAQNNTFPTTGNVTINGGHLVQAGANNNLQTQGAVKIKNYLLFDADGDFTGGDYFTIQDHSTNNYLRLGYGFSDHLVLTSSGSLGIGTTPSTKFQIRKDEDLAINSSNITSSNISGVRLSNLSNTNNAGAVVNFQLGGTGTSQAAIAASRPEANKSVLHFFTEHANSMGERVTITSDGDVGIGTTSPTGKLEVSTDSWLSSLLTLRDTHYSPNQVYHFQIESDGLKIKQDETVNYQFKSGGNFLVRNGRIGIGTTSPDFQLHLKDPPGGAALALERGGKLWKFDVAYNAASKLFIGHTDQPSLITLTDQGYMGVGTTSPQSKLAVNGQIRATEVKVLSDISVPDYVFEPDYVLRTLKETKKYIEENKHLPEIPSAAEIGENGIDLGDMNMRLLKKIEELTLYQIELLERLEKAEKKISDLESYLLSRSTNKKIMGKSKYQVGWWLIHSLFHPLLPQGDFI